MRTVYFIWLVRVHKRIVVRWHKRSLDLYKKLLSDPWKALLSSEVYRNHFFVNILEQTKNEQTLMDFMLKDNNSCYY